MLGDDLAPLLAQQPGPGLGFRQGVVLSWNSATAENTVEVAGTVMTNLPILNTNEALLLGPGSVVAVITAGSTWFILGRVTIPGTPDAASALSMVRTYTASVTAVESTTSTSYTDLATVGPTIADLTVGPSGRVLVMATTLFDHSGADSQAGGYMSFVVAGATSRPAADGTALRSSFSASDASADVVSWIVGTRMTATTLVTGLNPGLHTVTAKYRAINTNGCNFADRLLVVIPL